MHALKVDRLTIPLQGHDLKTLFTHRGTRSPLPDFEIAIAHELEDVIVHLSGRVNIESSPLLRDRLLCLLRDLSVRSVVIDLRKVSYVDTSGVATLIEALKFARGRRIEFHLKGLEGPLLHLFEVTGVLALFEMYGTAASASLSEVS